MKELLPRLRAALDVMPSPMPDRPGIVLRDPFRYSEDTLLIPPAWVPLLSCLDGNHSELDAQAMLVRHGGGELVFSDDLRRFVDMLNSRGFLETEEFFAIQERRQAEFRASAERMPALAGGAYPEDPGLLKETFDPRFEEGVAAAEPGVRNGRCVGLAAPHVSPDGGWDCYAAAYRLVDPSLAEKTFVILGTSHYGEPGKFGLTRKPFVTPLGTAAVDEDLVESLVREAPGLVTEEDYCHAIEHSIEFQVIFLQYRLGAPVTIVPILCGPLGGSWQAGAETDWRAPLQPFIDALTDVGTKRADSLFWVLGIDLAHMGKRYGDDFAVQAGDGPMAEVELRDRERLESVCAGDPAGFVERVQPATDELKWCGFSPLYTFMASQKPVFPVEARVLHYQQWNIDPQSVVSFAGLEFFEA
jgi:AmmeMemoRadiSam system protein B